MNTFSNIRFKKNTARRFQEFSRRFFKTHTEALHTMLDFFFYNEISPKETLGPNARTLENNIKKRINALISIIRDIEKHQTQPTTAMMQLLFEHTPQKDKQQHLGEHKKSKEKPRDDAFFTSAMEAIELQKQNTILKTDLAKTKGDLDYFLTKVTIHKSGLGKTTLKLDMKHSDFELLKSNYKTA